MATDSNRVTVAGRLRVYLAIVGTAAPADATVALGAAWREVGYTAEDATNFMLSDPGFNEIRAHQADRPIRIVQTTDAAGLEADLEEFSRVNLIAVLGGGTITTVTAGQYKYSPPAIGGRASTAAILEVTDGTKHYRWVVPRGFQREGVTVNQRKGEAKILPLRLGVQGTDVGDPWYLLTDDPAFDPAA